MHILPLSFLSSRVMNSDQKIKNLSKHKPLPLPYWPHRKNYSYLGVIYDSCWKCIFYTHCQYYFFVWTLQKLPYEFLRNTTKFNYLERTVTNQNCTHKEIKCRYNSGKDHEFDISPFTLKTWKLKEIKLFKLSGNDQSPAQLIQAGWETLLSVIHKLVTSFWNKEALPNQW
jgi:hypothetical protein